MINARAAFWDKISSKSIELILVINQHFNLNEIITLISHLSPVGLWDMYLIKKFKPIFLLISLVGPLFIFPANAVSKLFLSMALVIFLTTWKVFGGFCEGSNSGFSLSFSRSSKFHEFQYKIQNSLNQCSLPCYSTFFHALPWPFTIPHAPI